MKTFVETLLAVIFRSGFAVITLFFFVDYVRELWYLVTNRTKYEALPKRIFRGGEDADGPVLGTAGRLLLAYPLFIIMGGFVSYDTAIKVISYIQR